MNKTIIRHRKRQRKRQRGGSDSEWEMIEQPDELEMKIVNMTKGLPAKDRYELMEEFNKQRDLMKKKDPVKKIQALQRGRKTRQNLKKQKSAIKKIQARQRGRITRRKTQGKKIKNKTFLRDLDSIILVTPKDRSAALSSVRQIQKIISKGKREGISGKSIKRARQSQQAFKEVATQHLHHKQTAEFYKDFKIIKKNLSKRSPRSPRKARRTRKVRKVRKTRRKKK